jgi:predicted dehydrogenase
MERRNFLKKVGGVSAAVATGLDLSARETRMMQSQARVSANDKIRLGLIGAGIIGHFDMDTALKIPGTELVAVCDLYDGRLEFAREKWGASTAIFRDYRELLNRKDIDAVLICTPDHWHAQMSIDALKAGKHVYCEKPMVQRIEDGHKVIAAQRKSGKVFQVGSQRASSVGILEAKKQLASGIIGELNFVEAANDRWNERGAWNYSIPTDASPQTVDWDRFLGYAPKRPFDAKRFFRWRNYSDYGTGVAGDLFVHLITGLHTITGSLGPSRIFALGDLNYWKDGRDVNDLVSAIMDYPKTDQHPSFQFVTRCNLADGNGGGGYCRLVGTDGVIEIGWDNIKVRHFKRPKGPGYGGYDSYESFSAKQKAEFKKWYEAQYGVDQQDTDMTRGKEIVFDPPNGYDDRFDHFVNFFESARAGKPCVEDASFGLRAAGPSLACNLSVERRAPVFWDPVKMQVVKK